MIKLKIAYFGAPYFSARFLEKIINDKNLPVEVKLVVTQPDRPVGRKQILTPTPVKQVAERHEIEIITNLESIIQSSELNVESRILNSKLQKLDLALVFAYSRIIPENLLSIPKFGFWNIHPSLLPKYRGPSPITYPLINGDRETGVTIIKMDEKIDHGPIIAQQKLEIEETDRRPDLEIKLTDLGYELFKKTIKQLTSSRINELKFKEQDESQATYTKLLKKSDGFIDFENFKLKIENSPKKLYDLFRGLYPWPGLWTLCPKRLKITDLNLIDHKLIIKKVQLEGKKEVDWQTFIRAYNINIASPKE